MLIMRLSCRRPGFVTVANPSWRGRRGGLNLSKTTVKRHNDHILGDAKRVGGLLGRCCGAQQFHRTSSGPCSECSVCAALHSACRSDGAHALHTYTRTHTHTHFRASPVRIRHPLMLSFALHDGGTYIATSNMNTHIYIRVRTWGAPSPCCWQLLRWPRDDQLGHTHTHTLTRTPTHFRA